MKEKLKQIFTKAKDMFLNEIFPSDISCYNCGEEIINKNKYHLCDKCLQKINIIKNPCLKCGEELNTFTKYCLNCKGKKRNFDAVYSVATFDECAKELIYKLKYGGLKYTVECITPFLIDKYNEVDFKNIDLIMPVPLSIKRVKSRGFNQAQLLSTALSEHFKIEQNLFALGRVKNTNTQTSLTKQERRENLLNAFKVLDKTCVKGKNILVVDDIITTGATYDEIARVLKGAGANKVFGLTFCHTKNKNV